MRSSSYSAWFDSFLSFGLFFFFWGDQTRWLSFGEGIIVSDLEAGSSSEDSLRMKARPAPLESMVTIVERSAMHIRSGPVRALFPKTHSTRSFINLSTTIISRTAELLTASLGHSLKPVPLGHE
jgi:hypothetical protein